MYSHFPLVTSKGFKKFTTLSILFILAKAQHNRGVRFFFFFANVYKYFCVLRHHYTHTEPSFGILKFYKKYNTNDSVTYLLGERGPNRTGEIELS